MISAFKNIFETRTLDSYREERKGRLEVKAICKVISNGTFVFFRLRFLGKKFVSDASDIQYFVYSKTDCVLLTKNRYIFAVL